MKEKYNALFENVHLSESAKQDIEERASILYDSGKKGKKPGRPHSYIKVAALIMAILALGGTGTYAASHYNRLQHTLTDKKAQIMVQTAAPQAEPDTSYYDVKLSYLPEGYVQDKEDQYMYRDKKGDGYFSVILYHLQTEYHTDRAADQIREFQTADGQGYYGGRKYGYFAILTLKDKDYMIYIDSGNMSQEEVKKIAENASLFKVSKKSDIQASFIEWTEERQKETDEFLKQVNEKVQ